MGIANAVGSGLSKSGNTISTGTGKVITAVTQPLAQGIAQGRQQQQQGGGIIVLNQGQPATQSATTDIGGVPWYVWGMGGVSALALIAALSRR